MGEDQPTTEQPSEAQLTEPRRDDAQRFESLTRDPRRRLRELVAIPNRDRTDALWDEIIGLEIQLAPGNSAPSPQADAGRYSIFALRGSTWNNSLQHRHLGNSGRGIDPPLLAANHAAQTLTAKRDTPTTGRKREEDRRRT